MNHVTEAQIIGMAEKMNLSSHPTVSEMQGLADALGITYGRLSFVWDAQNLKSKVFSKKAIREREQAIEKKKKEAAKKEKHKCIVCGADLLNPTARLCPEHAYERLMERNIKNSKTRRVKQKLYKACV